MPHSLPEEIQLRGAGRSMIQLRGVGRSMILSFFLLQNCFLLVKFSKAVHILTYEN